MELRELALGRTWLVRLDTGAPLYAQLREAAAGVGVRAGTFTVLGAVRNAVVRYYEQEAKVYHDLRLDRHLEILSGVGNFSLRDGEMFLHCHVTLGDAEGNAWGGHLHETEPSEIFAAEVWLQELLGEPPVRAFDEATGLALWS